MLILVLSLNYVQYKLYKEYSNLSKGNNNLQKSYNITKRVGGNDMKGFLKKTCGVALIGLGLGILMVLLLPITGWLIIIGLAVVAIGFIWLAC